MRDAEPGRHLADKPFRIWRRDGAPLMVLIHAEVQRWAERVLALVPARVGQKFYTGRQRTTRGREIMSDSAVIEQTIPEITLPPTQDELPCDDGEPMETERHKLQMDLLIYPLKPWLKQHPQGGYVGGNMFVYFSMAQVRGEYFRGPDVFVVLGVPRRERKSWVVWEEGKGPDIIVELLSPTTTAVDKGLKKAVYQDQLKVAEYFWFDPFDPDDFQGFDLHRGVYEPIAPDAQGRLPSKQLGLALVRWQGVYEDVEATWLRWTTPEGKLLPTWAEDVETERQRAETAHQRAEAEACRAVEAEAEVARLRALLAERHGPSGEGP